MYLQRLNLKIKATLLTGDPKTELVLIFYFFGIKKLQGKENSTNQLACQIIFPFFFHLTFACLSTILKAVLKTQGGIIVKFHHQLCLHNWQLALTTTLITIALLIGCSQKTSTSESSQTVSISGTITEIDDHGNAVTDLVIAPFTERGWKLGDTLEATFATGQKIQIKYVENYGDVPEGDYLGRFSTSTQRFKIAINMGNIAKTLELSSPSKVVLQKVAPPAD